MGKPATNLVGQRFGKLLVEGRAITKTKSVRWTCRCDCGAAASVYGQNLRNGSVQSCGCGAHPTTHGMANTRLYQTWASMFARCRPTSSHHRKHYADKGIEVSIEWKQFDAFREWAMANGYDDALTIDRIDNQLGYFPDNCRFITIAEQQRNKSNHRMLRYGGETLALYQWAARTGLSKSTIHNRLSRGWSIERALTTLARRPHA